MSPEEKARLIIDKKLKEAGYAVQDVKEFNPKAALGVVVRGWQTDSGSADYMIFIDKRPVGVIEAKAHDKGESLTTVAEQTRRYAESELKYVKRDVDIRFAYEATDILVHFCDYHDKQYKTRQIFSFHQPKQLKEWMDDTDTLRNRLMRFPVFDDTGFRKCQTRAIVNLEESFANNRERSLIQMATGAGKTYTAITNTYRLLKFAKAKRVLFLVDTKNLGEQAEEEFRKYLEDVRKAYDQVIDNVNLDTVVYVGWDDHHEEKAAQAIETFQQFLADNRDELDALQIIYEDSYRQRLITLAMIKEVHKRLSSAPYLLNNEMLWSAYSIKKSQYIDNKSVVNKLVDIISLIRFEMDKESPLVSFADHVRTRFRDWIFAKNAGNVHFTEEQIEWLRMIRDHIAVSASISMDDLELTPFAEQGGLAKFYVVFGDRYEEILNEMNLALVA